MKFGTFVSRASALVVLLGLISSSQAAFITTGVYDEPVQLNGVDTLAAGSNRTLLQFTADIATAYALNRGGVVDFDTMDTDTATSLTVGDPGKPSYQAKYGVGQTNTLTVTRAEYIAVPAQFGMNLSANDGAGTTISGANAMGLSGNSNFTLLFSSPLREWGLTGLTRAGDRVGVMTITHTDGSSYVFASETISPVTAQGVRDDTLFSYAAPAGLGIRSVNWTGSFVRWDDMGFVVPEPTSIALAGIVGVCLLAFRKRA